MFNKKLLIQTDDFKIVKSSIMLLASSENLIGKKMKIHEGLPNYLRFLIQRYGLNLKNNLRLEFRNTKKYQTRGLKYARVKFEVDGNTWMAYQLLAFYHRISISYLFAILLSWDIKKGEKSDNYKQKSIVTMFSQQIQLHFSLFMDRIQKHDYECLLELKT